MLVDVEFDGQIILLTVLEKYIVDVIVWIELAEDRVRWRECDDVFEFCNRKCLDEFHMNC
jgi:hypothetical protein